MKGEIKLEVKDHLATVFFNRPQVHNALSRSMIDELDQIIKSLNSDDTIRAVIFTGVGEKSFSAGADLKERQTLSDPETLAFVEHIQATFQKIAELPMPTIASINGHAFGGGLELALACDIRVMNQDAQVGLVECGLGIIPGAGGTQRLPKIIGIAKAMELIFLAKRISGSEALSLGLVNSLAKNAKETLNSSLDMAHIIASNGPLAIRAAKEAILISQERPVKNGLVAELASYHEILGTKDRREGLMAFLQKRPPHFLGT
jgi:enoyl-CoA hydratase/carnithine racemase